LEKQKLICSPIQNKQLQQVTFLLVQTRSSRAATPQPPPRYLLLIALAIQENTNVRKGSDRIFRMSSLFNTTQTDSQMRRVE